jgi:hypothetical protein
MSENKNEMEYINYLGNILVYLKSLQSLADLLKTKLAVISVSYHPPHNTLVYNSLHEILIMTAN